MLATKAMAALGSALVQAGLSPRRQVPLATLCTWRIGGPADLLVEPASLEQLADALRLGSASGLPLIVFGRGSNLLFADAGLRGLAVRIADRFSRRTYLGNGRYELEAGAALWRLALDSCHRGLTGLEHTVGIPGTIGGLVAMNGGSLRRSIGESLEWVEAMDRRNGMVRRFLPEECDFAYRHSRFLNDPDLVVCRCGLKLPSGETAAIRREMLGILRERRQKFPLRLPNAGSVCKSTPGLFEKVGAPGRVVESLGLKGTQVGGARISEQHANFIVNTGGATAADVVALVQLIRQKSRDAYGIPLDTEVRYIHADGRIQTVADLV